MNLNDDIFKNPRKPRGVSQRKLNKRDYREDRGILWVFQLEWWVYVLMVMCLFIMCLMFNYIMKKINDSRLEDRLAKLYDKNSQSTQVQIALIEIDNDKKSPMDSTEITDPNTPGISLIFSKEENNKYKAASRVMELKESNTVNMANETVVIIENSKETTNKVNNTGPVIKDESTHSIVQTEKIENLLQTPPEIMNEGITIVPVDRRILDYKDEGFKPFSRHSLRNVQSRKKLEKTASVSVRTDEEDITRTMKLITPSKYMRKNQSMTSCGSKEDIKTGSVDKIKTCRSREIKSKSSKWLTRKPSIPDDLPDCPFDPDEVSGVLLDKLMSDIIKPEAIILGKIDEGIADDEDDSRIEVNSNN